MCPSLVTIKPPFDIAQGGFKFVFKKYCVLEV